MNYSLPKKIENYNFFCDKSYTLVNKKICDKTCKNNKCWIKHVKENLQQDCKIENERNIEGTKCNKCGNPIISTAFSGYLCPECGNTFFLDEDEMKNILGNNFQTINEKDLNELIDNATK